MHNMDLYEKHLTYNTKCIRWNAMGYILSFNALKSRYVKENEELCRCKLNVNDWPNSQGAHQNLQRLHFDIMRLLIHAFQTKVVWWYVLFFYKHRSFSFTLICECSHLSWRYLYEIGTVTLIEIICLYAISMVEVSFNTRIRCHMKIESEDWFRLLS